ncbi:MAG TPA: hypothetical protein VFI52_17840 [Gemmatimonadaceae bacterium]|nr:hypothetical protein [Gemmatimonadaceae bacterium]
MIRRIALTLCVAVLGAASLPETATPKASIGKTTVQVAAHSARRSGYIVASS